MERSKIFSVLFIHLSHGAWTIGRLESQMKSYILRAHKDDDDKGNKNNIWTFNSNPSNITLRLHYKDLSANAVYGNNSCLF